MERVNGERWRLHVFPVNQMFGVQSALPALLTPQQPVNDAELYIARLGEFPRKFAPGAIYNAPPLDGSAPELFTAICAP